MLYFEVEFVDGYSIACKGERVPNIDEATVFCDADVKEYGPIISVTKIDYDEVVKFFDTDGIESWPVFE